MFNKKSVLASHKHYQHPLNGIKKKQVQKQDQIFNCQKCEKTYRDNQKLREHVLKYHEKTTPFSCENCKQSFGLKSSLKTHIANMHKKVECEKCNLIISTSLMLRRHKAKVHGIKSATAHQCDFCSLVYEQKVSLEKHIAKNHSNCKKVP